LLFLAHAPRVAAQTASVESAEALFEQGRKLMSLQRYEEACTKFSASHRLDPAVGTLLNLGYCWKQLGKAASAWTAYREAASLAHWQRQREREAFARAEAAELETKLARLSIHVADGDHEGLELRRNGVPVPRDVWGVEVPVDPGEHTIEAVAPDRKRFSTRVRVQAASNAAVTVPVLTALPRAPDESAAAGAAKDAPLRGPNASTAADEPTSAALTSDESGGGGSSLLPALSIGLGAAGAVGLGLAGFFALRMQAQDEEARGICPDPLAECTSDQVTRHEDRKRAARDSRTAAYISAGAGAACVIGAIVLLVAAPDDSGAKSARAAGATLAIGVAPGELAIVASGRL
jgi:hypothetical protein